MTDHPQEGVVGTTDPLPERWIVCYARKRADEDEDLVYEYLAPRTITASTYRDFFQLSNQRQNAMTFASPGRALQAHARFVTEPGTKEDVGPMVFIDCPTLERA